MKREEKSRRSKRRILDAALELFSRRGYRGTQVRDIAERAGVSTGSVYHQFADKETLIRTLLDEYFEIVSSPDYPMTRAWAAGAFPDNMDAVVAAAQETLDLYRSYVALIYVDVVELDGRHIRRFYEGMADNVEDFLAREPEAVDTGALHPDVSPVVAVMFVTRFFFYFFTIEKLFGVPDHFGRPSSEVVREICGILRRGLLAS